MKIFSGLLFFICMLMLFSCESPVSVEGVEDVDTVFDTVVTPHVDTLRDTVKVLDTLIFLNDRIIRDTIIDKQNIYIGCNSSSPFSFLDYVDLKYSNAEPLLDLYFSKNGIGDYSIHNHFLQNKGVYSQTLNDWWVGYFPGYDQYISIPYDSTLKLDTAFSICIGFKSFVSSVGVQDRQILFGKRKYTEINVELWDGHICFHVRDPKYKGSEEEVSVWVSTSDKRYDDTDWHYVVAIWNQPFIYLYVDGEFKSYSENHTIIRLHSEGEIRIGHLSSEFQNKFHFRGYMNKVQVYNRVLSSDEIGNNYASFSRNLFK